MSTQSMEKIIRAAEELQDASGSLILAIDEIEEEEQRKKLRQDYAELIAFIEERFIFNLRRLD